MLVDLYGDQVQFVFRLDHQSELQVEF